MFSFRLNPSAPKMPALIPRLGMIAQTVYIALKISSVIDVTTPVNYGGKADL
jgi:hypothetical protein